MLKPALARGELRAIGATTLNEYRKYIEKDAALERRFQIVFVGEPNVEDTIAILRGLRERYEAHHGIRIKDSAIVAAAMLSASLHLRPLSARQGHRPGRRSRGRARDPDRFGPGRDRRSGAARDLARDRAQALKRETDTNSRERLQEVERELAEVQEQASGLRARWQKERGAIGKIAALKESLEGLRFEAERGNAQGQPAARGGAAVRRDSEAGARVEDG